MTLQIKAIVIADVFHGTERQLLGIDTKPHLLEEISASLQVAIEGAVGDASHRCQFRFTIGVLHCFLAIFVVTVLRIV